MLYAGVLVWMGLAKRGERSASRKVLFREFLYCFISFLPSCYYLLYRPTNIGPAFNLFIIIRLSTNGVLLLAMSRLVRRNLPFRKVLRCWKVRRASPDRGVHVIQVTSARGGCVLVEDGIHFRDNNYIRGCGGLVSVAIGKSPLSLHPDHFSSMDREF